MQGFYQQERALFWESDHEIVRIDAWGQHSLRVRATIGTAIRDELVGALLPPADTSVQIELSAEEATIRNGMLAAKISREGFITFIDALSGAELLAEERPLRATRIPPRAFKAQGELFHLEARFRAYDDERFYGLGQHQHGRLNQKGCTIDLIQRNTEVSIPFLLSSRGYGFLWNNPAVGRVELGNNQTRWVAEATPQLDYWITAGATPAAIMEQYADATGHPPEFPAWAAGFWQSKLRYQTQEELLSVAREYKRRGLPLSVIVIDYFHWTAQGDWRFDPECWPDPAAMVRELEELGVKLMVSIWPTVNAASENFTTMQQRGLLIRTERGIPVLMRFHDSHVDGPVFVYYYDSTHPEARQFIWQQVHDHYYKLGIKIWWLDACEPEMFPLDADNLRFHLGHGAAVANVYPLLHERAFYEGMRKVGETEILHLCRSAWAGSQRYGAAIWSGDIDSTFEALQAQVRAGLNMGLSGIPWWTTDIGGFYGGDPESPNFRELLVRWFQYSTFCPLFRLHGNRVLKGRIEATTSSGAPNEVWSFGEQAYEIMREFLFLRERLRPYLMQQMHLAHEKGIPPMRPLFFDFPDDANCVDIDDQFLLGPDLLVAPIVTAQTFRREVYLPAGITWVDAWTGQTIYGGQRIIAEAPLERIPLYLRAGSDLPIHTSLTGR
jgi:alpha-D-xyloside xylohydrolase